MRRLDEERSRLKELLLHKSLHLGEVFRLSSGAESDVYVDAKPTTCNPEAMPIIGRLFLAKMAELGWQPEAVGGLTVGADPIAFAVARESISEAGRPIYSFIVRKLPKKHGMARFIEGVEPTQGKRVVILDDVCTGGSSTGLAIEKAREAGMEVLGAVCLVDREEGAANFLAQRYGCTLHSIFKLSEFVIERAGSHLLADPVRA